MGWRERRLPENRPISLRATMKINFDATFDGNNARSALGVVVRNAPGEVVASKEINHRSVLMPFAAEAHA
ncbi:hypothetical protein Goarm_020417, partial [Gossypium armourianum]|nr:hypothetical protein [Gossypium armourianum]